ncbi:cupin domain-containing protein [Methylobacterium sp. GC_Met_2]|uniref:cupin domain-containing protein n=1 Tax=Methylobacterium sp. GC_Met_2 TaxID=2937376 RepID=UPI00226B2750|nr:cupin domain-containing protein [Methylobacterium sp. GC_Met_2]
MTEHTKSAELIRIGGLTLRFLQDRHSTGGALDLFEMTVQPGAAMPVAHYHETWDETVYGLSGTTWRIAGQDVPVGPGESVFIARGVVHGFRNDGNGEATCLSLLTPGVLGPEYFREMATLAEGAIHDPAAMKTVMERYGLIPSENG